MATLKTKLIIRNDSTANWANADNNSATPLILSTGELGIEWLAPQSEGNATDLYIPRLKIGDGATRWSNLPYYSGVVEIEGSGNTITDASFDEVTGILTLTKGTRVEGTGLKANEIILGNSDHAIKTSGITIVTTLGTNDKTVPTSKAVREGIAKLTNAGIVLKGTIGTDGTITELPAASEEVLGDAYKVITAGTYGGIVSKIGDLLVCYDAGTEQAPVYKWLLIPAGDEIESWRPVFLNNTQKLSSSLNSGNLILKDITNSGVKVDYNGGFTFDVKTGFNTNDLQKNYKVQKDDDGNLFVNIPWSDTTSNAYGKVTVSNNSDATDLEINQSSITAAKLSDNFTLTAANKWIHLAAAEGAADKDVIRIAHLVPTRGASEGTANTIYGSSENELISSSNKSFTVPSLSMDEAGHIKTIKEITVTIPDTAFLDRGADRGISLVNNNYGHSNTAITAQSVPHVWASTLDNYGHVSKTPSMITTLDGGKASMTADDWGAIE